MLIIIYLPFTLISSDRFVLNNDANLFFILKSIRKILAPFIMIIFGIYLNKVNYDFSKLIKVFIITSLMISIYGLFEVLVFNIDFLYLKILNIPQYFQDIKNQNMAQNTLSQSLAHSRSVFSLIGIKSRLLGLLIGPLTTGFYLAGIISVISHMLIFNINVLKKETLLVCLILLTTSLILTQSRSGWLFLLSTFIPVVIRTNKGKLVIAFLLLIVGSILTYFGITSFIFTSFQTLGGVNHSIGIIDTFNAIFDYRAFIGKGTGVVTILESGYGEIYSQFGFLGFLAFLTFIFNYISISSKLDNKYCFFKYQSIGYLYGILITMVFSPYAFSFKGFIFIWIFIGFTAAISIHEKINYQLNPIT